MTEDERIIQMLRETATFIPYDPEDDKPTEITYADVDKAIKSPYWRAKVKALFNDPTAEEKK